MCMVHILTDRMPAQYVSMYICTCIQFDRQYLYEDSLSSVHTFLFVGVDWFGQNAALSCKKLVHFLLRSHPHLVLHLFLDTREMEYIHKYVHAYVRTYTRKDLPLHVRTYVSTLFMHIHMAQVQWYICINTYIYVCTHRRN